MKIALLTTNAPPLLGGLERVTQRLAQHLQNAGDEAWIVTRFTMVRPDLRNYFLVHEASREVEIEGVRTRIIALSGWRRLLYGKVFRLIWRRSTFGIARLLTVRSLLPSLLQACRGADVIHYLGSGPEMLGFAAGVAARMMDIPFLVEPAMHPGQWGDSWTDLKLYLMADTILAHTQYEADTLEEMGVSAKQIRVIVHGVDDGKQGNGQRFRSSHRIPREMVLFLGRKTVAKGLLRVIKAFQTVHPRFPDAILVLAGPASTEFELPDDACILNLDNLSEGEKQDALAACDLLCVPSEGESFGMVYFEAWSHAKPVIALDLPALRESIGNSGGGLLVPKNHDALVEALAALLSDVSYREQLGAKGKARFADHGWPRAVGSYKGIYEEQLESRKY